MIQAILHADKEWGIGKNNDLMFSLPADMKFFRTTTQGGVVVMGDKTLFSLPGGRPLKNRTNIVLSFDMQKREDCVVVNSLDELKEELKKYTDTPVWVMGGATVYKLLLPYCDKVLVTRVEAVGGAEAFFPNLDEDSNFVLTKRGEDIEDNGYIIHFDEYTNLNRVEL